MGKDQRDIQDKSSCVDFQCSGDGLGPGVSTKCGHLKGQCVWTTNSKLLEYLSRSTE